MFVSWPQIKAADSLRALRGISVFPFVFIKAFSRKIFGGGVYKYFFMTSNNRCAIISIPKSPGWAATPACANNPLAV